MTTPLEAAVPGRSPVTQPGYGRGRRPANYGRTFPPEILEREEIERLLKACGRRGPSARRNYALIITLWRSGLRISEALALLPKDVNVKAGTIRVLHGKGDRARTIGMDPQAFAVLAEWLEYRRALVPASSPVFCTIAQDALGGPGRSVKSPYVRLMLKRVAWKARLDRRVHPHAFRHTCAYEMIMEGMPTNLVQAQLGHSSLATTDSYVSHIAPMVLVQAMAARRWDNHPAGAMTDEQIELAARRVAAVADGYDPELIELLEQAAERELRAAITLTS